MPIWTHIAAGGAHSIVVDGDGVPWAMGRNLDGQLGDGSDVDRATLTPLAVPPPHFLSDVSAGAAHSLAVTSTGAVLAWGRNAEGQLGLPGENGEPPPLSRSVPTAVPDLASIVSVAAGQRSSLALTANGSAWFFGTLGDSAGGQGAPVPASTPTLVDGIPLLSAVAAGLTHHLFLATTGEVWAWGASGEGGGAPGAIAAPARVPGLEGAVAIAAGAGFSLALLQDGTVWAWGDGRLGQLGDGTAVSRAQPAPVPGLEGVSAIAAGAACALARLGSGEVWGWGYDRYAELGDGGLRSPPSSPTGASAPDGPPWEVRATAVRVPDLDGADRLACGGHHGLALTEDGAVMGWGSSRHGQLGSRGDAEADIAARVVVRPTVLASSQGE